MQMNIHKVHQKDISRLHVFEQSFLSRTSGSGRLRYRDVFTELAKPSIRLAQRSEWDNYATAKKFASSYDPDVKSEGVSKKELTRAEMQKKPWYSKEACKKACEDWELCLSWKYADDNCAIDDTVAVGQRIDAGIRMESGWMLDRIAKLQKMECGSLSF